MTVNFISFMHPYSFLYKWGSHIHRTSITVSSQDFARDDNYVASTLHTPPQPLQRVAQYPRWLGNTMNEWGGGLVISVDDIHSLEQVRISFSLSYRSWIASFLGPSLESCETKGKGLGTRLGAGVIAQLLK